MSSASNDQGRAYEYICLLSLQSAIGKIRRAEIKINTSYHVAQNAWNTLSASEQTLYSLSAKSTIDTIFALEPNIVENGDDLLSLYIQTDKHGEEADDRDLIIERKDIIWVIRLSIKYKQFISPAYDEKNRGAFGEVYHTYDIETKRDVCHIILDSEFEYFEYNDVRYPVRYAHFWDMGVYIATKSLDNALFDEETGLPINREAKTIDDRIFYFVNDDEIYLPQHELIQLLEKQVA